MKNEEIKEQIDADYQAFLYQKYTGHIKPPKNILSIFKRAVFALPPYFHKIDFNKIEGIVKTKYDDLTNDDINEMVKLIFNTPLDKSFDSLEVAIPEMKQLTKFAVSYNTMIEEFQEKLRGKSTMLQSLSSGVLGGKNGMRIIN